MKYKTYITLIVSFIFCTHIQAQITTYSKWDNVEKVSYQVEDLGPEEIRTYNSFVNSGMSIDDALLDINAGRAHSNLEYAPATIVDYVFTSEVTDKDSIPEALGACGLYVELINSTPKSIREITLEFEFENNGTQVYDIKTGGKYCVLKFNNLKGRTKSTKYSDIRKTIFDCYHLLSISDASYKKLFYNKTATTMRLHRAVIKYNDGTISNKIAVFYNGYGDDDILLNDGPLKPLLDYTKTLKEIKSSKETKISNNTEAPLPFEKSFDVVEKMPSFPGGNGALQKWLSQHIAYPSEAVQKGIEGRVIVRFVVETDGSVSDVSIARGIDPALDKEALRVVKNMPKWIPGMQNGEPVRVHFNVPVMFKSGMQKNQLPGSSIIPDISAEQFNQ